MYASFQLSPALAVRVFRLSYCVCSIQCFLGGRRINTAPWQRHDRRGVCACSRVQRHPRNIASAARNPLVGLEVGALPTTTLSTVASDRFQSSLISWGNSISSTLCIVVDQTHLYTASMRVHGIHRNSDSMAAIDDFVVLAF
eukprot:m.904021 g.904021  ORF g.904021 m.904021 type:complete len:142 (+) comp23694_c0_seq58:2813-3238(+)